MKWGELVRAYCDHLTRRNLSPKHIETGRRRLDELADWLGRARGKHDPAAVSEADLIAWLEEFASRGLKLATYNGRVFFVRQFYRYAFEAGYLLESPARYIETASVPQFVGDYLSQDQVKRIMEQPDLTTPLGLRDRAILETLYSTAIRCFELAALDVGDVDFALGVVTVREGKGKKERRVPIGRIALSLLGRYVREVRRPAHFHDAALFVGTRSGRRINHTEIEKRAVKRYALAAGLEKRVYPHLLRHSCAIHMLENGADLRMIQALLGHSKLSTTQRYTLILTSHLETAHRRHHPSGERRADAPPARPPVQVWRQNILAPGERPEGFESDPEALAEFESDELDGDFDDDDAG